MSIFAGKKILLMAPVYFGYEQIMKSSLIDLGAAVVYVVNKSFRYDPLNKGTRWYETWFCKKDRYLREIRPIMSQDFDLCLFVNLFSFQESFIRDLRKQNPHIRCVLYLWDNIRDYKWRPFFPLFDAVFTFDPVEAKQHGLQYLPNFYFDPGYLPQTGPRTDFYFVGSFQSHRFYWLDRAARALKQKGFTYFFYLYMPDQYNRFVYNKLVYWVTRLFPIRFQGYKTMYDLIFKKAPHPHVHHESLTLQDTLSKLMQTNCVIDLPFPTQTGSTQRVIQALAFHKKVLTTNTSVIQESFFDGNSIRMISTEDIDLLLSLHDKSSNQASEISHLRVDNWLRRLLTPSS